MKRKPLDEHREDKKKTRQCGKVHVPQETFIAALKVDVQRAVFSTPRRRF